MKRNSTLTDDWMHKCQDENVYLWEIVCNDALVLPDDENAENNIRVSPHAFLVDDESNLNGRQKTCRQN